jgi:hypothetical protein
MHRRAVLFAIAAYGLLPLRDAGAQAPNPAFHRVSKIQVAAMGPGAEAARFHSLLEDALRNTGFEITDIAADAILTGAFTAESHGDFSSARVTATLKSANGKQILWSGDYISQHRGSGKQDVVKETADTCAEQLRKSWEKSAN